LSLTPEDDGIWGNRQTEVCRTFSNLLLSPDWPADKLVKQVKEKRMLAKDSTQIVERRAQTRVETYQPVTVGSLSSVVSQPAKIIDCSHDGFCLLLSAQLEKGQLVTICRSTTTGVKRELIFEVRWVLPSDGRFLAGVRKITSA
jgi:hypothetical protein